MLSYINLNPYYDTFASAFTKTNLVIAESIVQGTFDNNTLFLTKFNGEQLTITGLTASNTISGLTYSDVVNALGYIPLSGISSTNVVTALGYFPLSAITSNQIINALGYTPLSSSTGTNGIQFMTFNGDVQGSGTTAITLTFLTQPNLLPGIYNAFAVNTKGLITSAFTNTYLTGFTSDQIQNALGYIPLSSITLTGDVFGSGNTLVYNQLIAVTTPSIIGSATQIPVLQIDAKGRVISATTVNINIPSSSTNGHTIQYSGISLPNRTNLNFIGDGFFVYDSSGNNSTVISSTSITYSAVTSVLGYVPYNGGLNPNRYISSVTYSAVTSVLGLTNVTSGSVLFITSNGLIGQDNQNLFYDTINKRLGIGTNSPTSPLSIITSGLTNTRETILTATVSDATSDIFFVYNGTSLDNAFVPSFGGIKNTSNVVPLQFVGFTTNVNDNGTSPLISIGGIVTSLSGNPANGTLTQVSNRPILNIKNLTTDLVSIAANGNVGIGIINPTAKLHVSINGTSLDNILTATTTSSDIAFMSNNSMGLRQIVSNNINSGRAVLHFIRTRGVSSATTAVVSGDTIGDILFGASDGTQINNAAAVVAFADGVPTAGNTPMRLSFVTGTNAATRTERLSISNTGNISFFGDSFFNSSRLIFNNTTTTLAGNDGIYRSATNVLDIFINGSDKLIIDANGIQINGGIIFNTTSIPIGVQDGIYKPSANTISMYLGGSEQFRLNTNSLQYGSTLITNGVGVNITKSVLSSAGLGRGVNINQLLTATGYNQILVGENVDTSFSTSGYTGTTQYIVRHLANGAEKYSLDQLGFARYVIMSGTTFRGVVAGPDSSLSATYGIVDPVVNQQWTENSILITGVTKGSIWGVDRGQLTIPSSSINRAGCRLTSDYTHWLSGTTGAITFDLDYSGITIATLSAITLTSLTTSTPAMIVTKVFIDTENTGISGILKGRIDILSYSPINNILIGYYSLPFRTVVNLTSDQILRLAITFNTLGNAWAVRSGITLIEG